MPSRFKFGTGMWEVKGPDGQIPATNLQEDLEKFQRPDDETSPQNEKNGIGVTSPKMVTGWWNI